MSKRVVFGFFFFVVFMGRKERGNVNQDWLVSMISAAPGFRSALSYLYTALG